MISEDELAEIESVMGEIEELEKLATQEGEKTDEKKVSKEKKAAEPESVVPPSEPKAAPVKAQSKPTAFDAVTFAKKLRDDVTFSELSLNEDFMKQAALVAYYSTVAHKSMENYEKVKARLDLVEATIDNELRNEALDTGKKITEASVAKQIILDPRYQDAQRQVIEARTKAGITKDALEALRHKRDMLIQVGADQREEMKGELRLNKRP